MADSVKENTDWISTWIINDPEYYDEALYLAGEGSWSSLGDYLMRVLKSAPEGSGAWHTAQEMTATDYGRVDWKEIMNTLLDK